MNIDKFYKDVVCNDIALQIPEMNKRTGIATRSLPGITFQTDLEHEGFPLLSLRKMPLSFVPEIMWFLSGKNNTSWLSKYTSIWNAFTEESGTVTSAYGWRWRHWFQVDQLEIAIGKLQIDPSTRHAIIMMWDPAFDSIVKQKNVPCPILFSLNIIQGRLHLHLVIRSNDMILGAPTDYAGFALLQMILAQKLDISPGVLTVSVSNAHVYENQMFVVEELRKRQPQVGHVRLLLPIDSYERACKLDDSLVQEIKDGFSGYNPSSAIVNIPIAL